MTTLTIALQDYILSCRADGKGKSTVDWYRSILGRFVTIRPYVLLKDISTNDIREYISALWQSTYAEETIKDHIRALHTFFAWCSAEYAIPQKMKGRIKYPDQPKPTLKIARIEDVQAMFEATLEDDIGIRNRAILMFMLDTGCRAAGVCGLRVNDLDIPGRRAFVTEKGEKTRAVVFTAITAKLLRDWMRVRKTAQNVFYNMRTLIALTTNGLYQLFTRLGEEAGVKDHCNPHSFRHLFATSYLLQGGDVATLSRLLGHRDVSTTLNNYISFTDRETREKHEKYSPVSKLFSAKPSILRDGELFLMCKGINDAASQSLPQLVYVTWDQQAAYDYASEELSGCQWQMLHCPNGFVQSPTYIIDRSWHG